MVRACCYSAQIPSIVPISLRVEAKFLQGPEKADGIWPSHSSLSSLTWGWSIISNGLYRTENNWQLKVECQCLNHILVIFQGVFSLALSFPLRLGFLTSWPSPQEDFLPPSLKSSLSLRVLKVLPDSLTRKAQNSCSLFSFPPSVSLPSPTTPFFFSLFPPSFFKAQFYSPYLKLFDSGCLCVRMKFLEFF